MNHTSNVVLLGKVKENLNMNFLEVPLPSTTNIHKLVNNQLLERASLNQGAESDPDPVF
jgi:hypothetical protein